MLVSLPYAVGVGDTHPSPPLRHEEEPPPWPPPVTLRSAGSPAALHECDVWMRAHPCPNRQGSGARPCVALNRPLHIGLSSVPPFCPVDFTTQLVESAHEVHPAAKAQ